MKEKFKPVNFYEKIIANIDYDWKVIVIAKENKEEDALKLIRQLGMLSIVGDNFDVSKLNLISGFAATIFGDKLMMLAHSECISAIWHIDEDIYNLYVRIIKSLEDIILETLEPVVINISLSPPEHLIPMEYLPDEPIHIATKKAAQNNKIIVFAAGNSGPKENTLNPWSLSPWVISVGATSKDGNHLAGFSSRGCDLDILNRPTVVAPGIDIITTHPPYIPKSKVLLDAEKRTGFYEKIKKEDWLNYTVVSGTSIAAPHVSRISLLIIHYLLTCVEEYKKVKGTLPKTIAQIYTHDQTSKLDERVTSKRIAGYYKDTNKVRTVVYSLNEPFPLTIKQILMDMAIAMVNYKPHEVGSGFVNMDIATQYFSKFGQPDPDFFVYKVIE